MTSPSDPTAALKKALRAEAAARRAAVHAADGDSAGSALADRFLATFFDRLPGAVVSVYMPMRDEIDVWGLIVALGAAGARTALPVMAGPDAPLIFRAWRMGDDLVPRAFGVQEPADTAPEVSPDIVIVPLLAFDAAGNRLGYGGGYYDRTLRGLRSQREIVAVGVGYDAQEFPDLPGHTGDEILDMIVTDRRILRVGE